MNAFALTNLRMGYECFFFFARNCPMPTQEFEGSRERESDNMYARLDNYQQEVSKGISYQIQVQNRPERP